MNRSSQTELRFTFSLLEIFFSVTANQINLGSFFCPLVWLAVTLKLAHFFISEVAQVFIRNRTLDFTNAEDVFLRSIKNLQ